MSRVNSPPDDELFRRLRDTERRLSAMERRYNAALEVVPPSPAMGGNSVNNAYGNSNVDRAFSHLLLANAARVAFLFDVRSLSGKPTSYRLVAVNADNRYQAVLPAWQVLAEFTTSSVGFVFKTGNVALPDEVRDGGQWNFSVHGRIPSGNGVEQWEVRAWALILTDDPDFKVERGDSV